jgi:hypothetical protein
MDRGPIRIAFAGLMRSGKDTAVEHLIATKGGYIKKLAAPLYQILEYAQDVAGFPKEKDRQFLQWVGTEWGRAKDEDVWVDALIRQIETQDTPHPIYISDARFVNEFEALRAAGFILVKINRDESARFAAEGAHLTLWQKLLKFFGIKPKFAVHASERDVLTYKNFDAEISNNGTLEDFYKKVDAIVDIFYGEVV